MCQFKSAIILKERIYCPLNKDSHSDMLEDLGIKDDSCFPNFVRIEMIPKDGDIFNHNINNWEMNVKSTATLWCVLQNLINERRNLNE
jgi:hypothetical protein